MISVIIPIMNEEGNIELLVEHLTKILSKQIDFEVIFIDDGSTDGSISVLKKINTENGKFKYISFSRNFGHQNALKAGLDFARGDCVISMDGDFQHPVELIPEMIKKWKEGYDIIYTIRQDDQNTGLLKRSTAKLFYRILNQLSDIDLKQGSADFRLLDRYVVEVLKKFNESPLFYRGLTSWLGFKQYGIPYIPKVRLWGKTKYSFLQMIKLALSGITGFSVKPLQISFRLGFYIAIIAFIYGIYALYIRLFTDKAIEGWTSLLIVILLIGGIQLITIGILGEYVGKLFIEHKKRPHYIIKEQDGV